jgi:hypothetical protein
MLMKRACPQGHAWLPRRSLQLVDTVAYGWAVEALLWVGVAVLYVVLSALHAEAYVWMFWPRETGLLHSGHRMVGVDL